MENFHVKLYSKAVEFRKKGQIERDFEKKFNKKLDFSVEYCYHFITDEPEFLTKNWEKLESLLSHSPFEKTVWRESQFNLNDGKIIEIGPRTAVKTASCTNILSVFESCEIQNVKRIERGIRYLITEDVNLDDFFEVAADKMTEEIYPTNVKFEDKIHSIENVFLIDVLASKQNLIDANVQLGLALDEFDLDFYYDFFVNKVKKNPTDVELFDLAQSDSEHSRHWFFRGEIWIDGQKREHSLMKTIRNSLDHSNDNSLIAFCDNSSSIRGFERVWRLIPSDPSTVSPLISNPSPSHLIYSAETHNFPTAVCPFQGATTGTGGRIRDIHATGRGAYEIAGTVGYSFGNLNIPGLSLPWEDNSFVYPTSISEPTKIAIEASNGASDYGNKFGEPVICGFARSFGQRLENGERCEYLKPIMFSGGIGAIDEDEIHKEKCSPHQKLVKIGGPVYRIGVGGGAASSVSVQGNRDNHLDFAAVQRGDAEMGGKLHRVVRACAERIGGNPLMSIHDQGAGGNGNVIKELVEGCGVTVRSDTFQLGDESISLRELWTAEYQENDAALVDPSLLEALRTIAKREKCHVSVVGDVVEEQRVKLIGKEGEIAVDLDTRQLGEREKKVFHLKSVPRVLKKLELPNGLTVREALGRVLKLPTVASKRYLTCKVDRSVTGLVAQQQCIGPLHTPLADVAVVALSHFDTADRHRKERPRGKNEYVEGMKRKWWGG
uniref:Phosphoribosylformylglycinamidine synthase n=1 Tax=Caenorhabditis tropicalis TaxID=1561998 RepID=A0A1I7T2F5_9PELO